VRYDTPVYFQSIIHGEYNPATGNYAPDTETEVKRYASVTSSGIDTLNLVYGELKQGSLTIRLKSHFIGHYDRIRMGEEENAKFYRVDMSRPLRVGHTFVVSEVQTNGRNQG
jgi:hypothetical protein